MVVDNILKALFMNLNLNSPEKVREDKILERDVKIALKQQLEINMVIPKQ